MQFTPKTEKELAEENLIPAANYPFEVLSAESKRSKAGNDMIEIELRIFMPDGTERRLRDWLMEKIAYKLFHFCATCGLSGQYSSGMLVASDCVGKTGYAKIGISVDKTGQYPDQNSVKDYVRADDKSGTPTSSSTPRRNEPTDAQLANQSSDAVADDVPF